MGNKIQKNMGLYSYNYRPSQYAWDKYFNDNDQKEFCNKTGLVHVDMIGCVVWSNYGLPIPDRYYQDMPEFTISNMTGLGKWICDEHGIVRQGNWVHTGELSKYHPEIYQDVKYHHL